MVEKCPVLPMLMSPCPSTGRVVCIMDGRRIGSMWAGTDDGVASGGGDSYRERSSVSVDCLEVRQRQSIRLGEINWKLVRKNFKVQQRGKLPHSYFLSTIVTSKLF